MTIRETKLAAVFSAILISAAPMAAHSGSISFTFDPTGTAGAAGDITGISIIDEAPGNALAIGGVTAIQNFLGVGPGTSTDFDLIYQANLGTMQAQSSAIKYANGLGPEGNHFTVVAGFGETVASSSGFPGTATFDWDPTSTTNFFKIYRTDALGNNLTGEGFAPASADLIMDGTITGVKSSGFNLVDGDPTGNLLDQSGGDDWGGVTSVTGSGATDLIIRIDSVDADYFPSFDLTELYFSFLNTSQVAPYNDVDPSRKVVSLDGTGDMAISSLVGARNGIDGPDFLFQTDANQSIIQVPEPTPLALLALGVVTVGFVGRRSRRNRV